jgi:hypothetical protein
MQLSHFRHRLLSLSGTWRGRVVLGLVATALLASSLPDRQWHSHIDGETAHVHPVHDAGIAPDEPHEHGEEPGSASFHFHDGNHCSAAPMTLPAPCVERLAQHDRAPGMVAVAPPATALIPPYRPPIV